MAWQINFTGSPNDCTAALGSINTNGTAAENAQLTTARTAITAEIARLNSNALLQVIANGGLDTAGKWTEASYLVQVVRGRVNNEVVLPPP